MFSIKQTNMILHQSLIKQTRTSDHVEYTRKSQLTEDESKYHKNNKGSCGQKQTPYWERMEAIGPVV